MSTEERIEQLKRGIANPAISDVAKEQMRKTLYELENPKPKPRRGNPAFQKGKPAPYQKPEPRIFTDEEKEHLIEQYRKHRERKKQNMSLF